MHKASTEELLILTKTYPSPSAQYRETTCVAAVNREGKLRRLFPVPYRLLDGESQFKRLSENSQFPDLLNLHER